MFTHEPLQMVYERPRVVEAYLRHEVPVGIARQHRHLLSVHGVEDTGQGAPRILPGKLCDARGLRSVMDRLRSCGVGDGAWIEPNTLFLAEDRLVFWVPAAIRTMPVRLRKQVRYWHVPYPALLLDAHRSSLRVFALGANRRPGATTPLYHAPVGNIYADARLCWGDVPQPRSHAPAAWRDWLACVTDSVFSHVNHDRTMRIPGMASVDSAQHFRLWKELREVEAKRFPRRHLVPFGQQLGSLVAEGEA